RRAAPRLDRLDDLGRPRRLPDVVHADGITALRAESAHGRADATAPSGHDQDTAHSFRVALAAHLRARITSLWSCGDHSAASRSAGAGDARCARGHAVSPEVEEAHRPN